MKPIKLELGELMEIRLRISNEVFSSNSFKAKVQDIISDKDYLITPPVDNNVDKWIGKIIKISIPRSDGAYSVTAKITGKKYEGSLIFLHTVLLEDFIRIQRREFFRLKYPLDVNIEDHGIATTIDISGNGLAIKSDFDFEENERIKGKIRLDTKIVEFSGTVVRCEKTSDRQNLACIYLDDIDRETQDSIIKFIYDKQVEMLKYDSL